MEKAGPQKMAQKKGRARRRSSEPTAGVGRGEAARLLGVPPDRISRWVEDGAPVVRRGRRGQPGLYDPEALRAWREAREAKTEAALSLEEERAKLARQQRIRIEMENAIKRRELVTFEDAALAPRIALQALKARLLQAGRVCVLRGVPAEYEQIIKRVIVEALRDLARQLADEEAEEKAS